MVVTSQRLFSIIGYMLKVGKLIVEQLGCHVQSPLSYSDMLPMTHAMSSSALRRMAIIQPALHRCETSISSTACRKITQH